MDKLGLAWLEVSWAIIWRSGSALFGKLVSNFCCTPFNHMCNHYLFQLLIPNFKQYIACKNKQTKWSVAQNFPILVHVFSQRMQLQQRVKTVDLRITLSVFARKCGAVFRQGVVGSASFAPETFVTIRAVYSVHNSCSADCSTHTLQCRLVIHRLIY